MAEDNVTAGVNDKTLIVLGEKKSGKSSLITAFLNESSREESKTTAALEFRFGRKIAGSSKEVVNIYELGGGRLMSNLISAPLTGDNIVNCICMIVLDLSKPGLVLDSLEYWLNVARENIDIQMKSLKPEQQ